MAIDPVADARAAWASGEAGLALRVGWEAARPAVLAEDVEQLTRIRNLAEEIAGASTGETQLDAEQLCAYCDACIRQPRDPVPPGWSMKGLFRRRTSRKKCPDCAEMIDVEARVCRFCGYRFAPAPGE